MKNRPTVVAVTVTFNSAKHIGECLGALESQSFGRVPVIVVDSQSTDDTHDLIRRQFPDAEVLPCDRNVGYRDGNRLGMSSRSADYIAVLNDDLALAPDALKVLIDYMEERPEVALTTPMVLLRSDPDLLNTAGNRLSFCGLPSCRGKGRSLHDFRESGPVAAVAGCAFVIRGSVLEQIGGLSADFGRFQSGWHASLEDADLSLRAWIAGYEVHYVAEAVALHHYSQRGMSVQRYASLECGRNLLLLRNFERKTLLRLAPAIIAVELAMLLYAALRGPKWLKARIEILRWTITHRHEIGEMRRLVQRVRAVPDRRFLSYLDDQVEFSGALGGSFITHLLERFSSTLLRIYRRVFLPGSYRLQ